MAKNTMNKAHEAAVRSAMLEVLALSKKLETLLDNAEEGSMSQQRYQMCRNAESAMREAHFELRAALNPRGDVF